MRILFDACLAHLGALLVICSLAVMLHYKPQIKKPTLEMPQYIHRTRMLNEQI